jgi:hypothetical protein
MRELLKSIASPADLLDLTREELAQALLRWMQQRKGDRIHRVNRISAVSELFSIPDPISQNPFERRCLEKKWDTAFRKAFDQLENWDRCRSIVYFVGFEIVWPHGISPFAHIDAVPRLCPLQVPWLGQGHFDVTNEWKRLLNLSAHVISNIGIRAELKNDVYRAS